MKTPPENRQLEEVHFFNQALQTKIAFSSKLLGGTAGRAPACASPRG